MFLIILNVNQSISFPRILFFFLTFPSFPEFLNFDNFNYPLFLTALNVYNNGCQQCFSFEWNETNFLPRQLFISGLHAMYNIWIKSIISNLYVKIGTTNQGSKGIKQWPINWCIFPMMTHKLPLIICGRNVWTLN